MDPSRRVRSRDTEVDRESARMNKKQTNSSLSLFFLSYLLDWYLLPIGLFNNINCQRLRTKLFSILLNLSIYLNLSTLNYRGTSHPLRCSPLRSLLPTPHHRRHCHPHGRNRHRAGLRGHRRVHSQLQTLPNPLFSGGSVWGAYVENAPLPRVQETD